MNEVINVNKITIQDVYKEIRSLGNEVRLMREEMADMFLSPEDEVLFEDALKEHRAGMTTRLEDFEKELIG